MFVLAGATQALRAALLVLVLSAAAPEPPPRPPLRPPALSTGSTFRDLEVTVAVRKALSQDESLAQANVSVEVREGVVVLSGAVPSAELVTRAISQVEQIRGVFAVKSQLAVVEPPPLPLFPRRVEKAPLRVKATEPRGEVAAPKPTPLPTSPEAALGSPQEDAAPREAGPTRVVARSVDAEATTSIAEEIERIRLKDRRYRLIRVEVHGEMLVVRDAASPETAMAFAEALRQIKGVETVVIDQSRPRR
jgi:osmotically-inducible protein OsmY